MCAIDGAECLLMAKAVEKVRWFKLFGIKLHKILSLRINLASGPANLNHNCSKFEGSDFFNSLSQEET